MVQSRDSKKFYQALVLIALSVTSLSCVAKPRSATLDRLQAKSFVKNDGVSAITVTPDMLRERTTKDLAEHFVARRSAWLLGGKSKTGFDQEQFTEIGVPLENHRVIIFHKTASSVIELALDGLVKNQYQSLRTGGLDLHGDRFEFESKLIGADLTEVFHSADAVTSEAAKELLPKYGFFATDSQVNGERVVSTVVQGFDPYSKNGTTALYGTYGVLLKEQVLSRSIFSGGDSLVGIGRLRSQSDNETEFRERIYNDGWVKGIFVPILAPFFRVPATALAYSNYMEAIVFGRIDREDIEAIVVPGYLVESQKIKSEIADISAAAESVRIPVYRYTCNAEGLGCSRLHFSEKSQ